MEENVSKRNIKRKKYKKGKKMSTKKTARKTLKKHSEIGKINERKITSKKEKNLWDEEKNRKNDFKRRIMKKKIILVKGKKKIKN